MWGAGLLSEGSQRDLQELCVGNCHRDDRDEGRLQSHSAQVPRGWRDAGDRRGGARDRSQEVREGLTMILRFVQESIVRAPRRKALIIAAIAMGSAVATAMLGVMLDIGDKINTELRSEGANIAVTAQAAAVTGGVGSIAAGRGGTADYIPEAEVPNIKKIFWGLNVIGFSPSLSAQDGALRVEGVWFKHPYPAPSGGTQYTGLEAVNPAWHLREGHWPEGALNECIVGSAVARRNGWKARSEITVLGAPFRVAGILLTGD